MTGSAFVPPATHGLIATWREVLASTDPVTLGLDTEARAQADPHTRHPAFNFSGDVKPKSTAGRVLTTRLLSGHCQSARTLNKSWI